MVRVNFSRYALAGALLCAAVAAWANWKFLRSGEAKQQVVVALKEIQPFTPIPADAVAIKSVPQGSVPKDALTKVESLQGQYSRTLLVQDDVVRTPHLIAAKGNNMAARVPVGKRAMALQVNPATGVAGTLQEGDPVDVLVAIQGVTNKAGGGSNTVAKVIAHRVPVLWVQSAKEGALAGSSQTTVVLEVTAEQAEDIAFAQASGQIWLLTNPYEADADDSDQTAGVNLDSFLAKYRLVAGPVPPTPPVASATASKTTSTATSTATAPKTASTTSPKH